MYRSNKEYDDIKKEIINIYLDYDIKCFPVSAIDLCKKMKIDLKLYSKFTEAEKQTLYNFSNLGFYVMRDNFTPTIYANDEQNIGTLRMSIFHEIKHYVYGDHSAEKDDLADFFARYIMCPIPYLMLKNITSVNKIVKFCQTNEIIASHVVENIANRQKKYGNAIFEYEVPLIQHLDPSLITSDIAIIYE